MKTIIISSYIDKYPQLYYSVEGRFVRKSESFNFETKEEAYNFIKQFKKKLENEGYIIPSEEEEKLNIIVEKNSKSVYSIGLTNHNFFRYLHRDKKPSIQYSISVIFNSEKIHELDLGMIVFIWEMMVDLLIT